MPERGWSLSERRLAPSYTYSATSLFSVLRCLISRGKIIFKPHKWWCFWKKRNQQKGKPTSPKCKDFDMNLLIVCIIHPHSWCLVSLKSFQFPEIIWDTPTPRVLINSPVLCVCGGVCVCAWETEKGKFWGRERENQSTLVNYTAWAPAKTGVGSTVMYIRIQWAWVFLHESWISLLRMQETLG